MREQQEGYRIKEGWGQKQYYRTISKGDIARNEINMATNKITDLEERLVDTRGAKELEGNRLEFQST